MDRESSEQSAKSTADGALLTVLQDTISTTLKQWLDQNRAEFLRVARAAILDNNTDWHGLGNHQNR